MKKFLRHFFGKMLTLVTLLAVFANQGKAQITMSTANCTISANEVQMDILITNNGATSLRWASTVLRMTVPTTMIPAGVQTYTWNYLGGSDFPLSFPAPGNNSAGSGYNAAARLLTWASTDPAIYSNGTCTAPEILPNETKTIGRFSFKITSTNFVAGGVATFVWQTTSSCNLYPGCITVPTGYNQASGLRTLAAPCTLTVPAACTSPTVNSNPTNQTICSSGTATFTGSFTGGTPVPTLLWQVQTGGVGLFTDLTETAPYSGTTTGTLTITTPNISLSTNNYRLKATNTCGDVFTNSASLTINANANAGTVSGTSPLCIGATANYTSNGDAGGTWSSTNTAVATVDAAGLVTALTAGTTDITYTLSSGCNNPVSSFKTLTVSPNVTAGTISGTSPLCINATTTYSSNGTAGGTWSSTNTAVATVDGSGFVTALSAGTTDITYTVNTGCGSPVTNFKTLTVSPNVTAGTVSGTSPLCFNGSATYSNNGTSGGTWSSSNTGVATVDLNSGLVTAVGQGTTNIIYTVNSGCNSPVSASQSLTVKALDYANLQFPPSGTICPGGSFTAYGQVYEAGVTEAGGQGAGITVDFGYSTTNSNPSTWTNWSPATFNVQVGNNDEYMATIGSALTSGTYYYTFRYSLNGCGYQYGGYSGGGGNFWDGTNYISGVLTVSPNANAGTVSGTSPLCIGATTTFTSNGDAGGNWSSTNTAIATVDAAGLVTALTAGTTDITYTVNTGCGSPVSSFKTLTVSPNANAGTVSGTSPLCIGATANYTSNGDAGGNWSSTNTAVATVDAAGLVTALTAGTTDITYTVSSGCNNPFSSFKTLTVSPNANAGTVSGSTPLCISSTTTYTSNGDAGGTWSSTNTAVATVDAAGFVTALTAGTTDITYTVNTGCGNPVSAFKTLTVSPNANAGTVSGTSPLCVGNTTTFSSNGNAGGAWSSTNTAVATVNAAGLVSALTAGTTDITYTVSSGCNNPVSSFKTLTVNGSAALAGSAGGSIVCSNSTVQPAGTYFSDASCNAIANVLPSGLVPVTGNINTCVSIEDVVHTYHNIPYVQRHYDIIPATNAANATATITLYYTQAEFDVFNLARGAYPNLPGGPADAVGIGNLRITQFHGTGTYPGNYSGNSELINPADNNIVWNVAMSRWEITFDINGFSGFYVFTDPSLPLPITLLNFSGKNNGSINQLDWSTSSEQNSSYFDLQRSTDGINFVHAGTITAAGNSSTSRNYSFNDNISSINSNLYYYRLKMVDITGVVKYSSVVKLRLNSKGFNVEATPNPFSDQLRINVETPLQENATISIKDISGKKIQQKESLLRKGSNAILLTNLDHLPGAVYLLTITTDSQQQTIKVIKQ